ncbi:hypothetical protein F5Y19DRAFT_414299 [Xylariaceae sp. FL1651]|nr:hypothetical protein F5Y19DRAFT_414299 [Xylariaceae sp. FL1651]
MAIPGLMYVGSRVRNPQRTSDELYNRFYNDEHLPEVLSHGHSKLALRYKNADINAPLPYIALYPIDDASFIGSPTSKQLIEDTKRSKMLGCDNIFELIYFEMRPYEKIQTYEAYGHENDSGQQRGSTLLCVTIEPAEGQDEDFDAWYRKQYLDMLGMCEGYRRCTRYRRKDGAFPRFIELHEFDCLPDELPTEQITQVRGTTWSQEILNEAKFYDHDVFTLIQTQGDTHLKL